MQSFEIIECREVRHTLGQHPAVARTAGGDLLILYGDYTDQMEGQQGYLIRSTDGGKTWADPELVLAARWWHGGVHTSLGMQTLRSGRILLPFDHGGNHKKHHDTPMRFVCLRSDDDGHAWQGWDEQDVGMHQFSPYGKIVELPDGKLICPGWGMTHPDDSTHSGSRVVHSHDGGVTWGQWNHISDQPGANETDLTLLPDGRVLAMIRTGGYGQHKLFWTDYAFSTDGGLTFSRPEHTNVLGQNFNAWVTSDGTLVGACRGIDGTGHLYARDIRDGDVRHTDQKGYGIHFFVAEDDGRRWRYQFTLPDPAGHPYAAWHEAGEPCFCNTADGNLMIVYYSYDPSIMDTLTERPMPQFTAGELRRIPHVFSRRICLCVLRKRD